MHHYSDRLRHISRSIRLLWVNWAISVGFLVALVAVAPLVRGRWMPIIAVGLYIVLLWLDRRNRLSPKAVCFRVPHMVEWILVICAFALALALIYTMQEGATEWTGQPADPNNPQIPVLVISPVATIVALYYFIKRRNASYCRDCRRRNGGSIDSGIMGIINSRETSIQIKLLFYISIALSVVTWLYYFIFYVNVNFNSADRFFFIVAPIVLYLISLIYLGSRYYALWIYYCKNTGTTDLVEVRGTTLRYIIICKDKFLLAAPEIPEWQLPKVISTDELKVDTPLKVKLSYRESVTENEARQFLVDATGEKDAEARLAYVTNDVAMYFNAFHYLAWVEDADAVAERMKGQWFNLGDVRDMIRTRMVSSAFASEMERIYQVAMAWKTYDNRGFRLYDIKHYRPTFRVADIRGWDVDFNDPNWLQVSLMNEDKRFFRARRLWNKIVRGLGE